MKHYDTLREMLIEKDTFNGECLFSLGTYLCGYRGDYFATLDGQFSADQLEAVAAWMRNPEMVARDEA
jgi:hypothetical protein